MNCPCGDPQGPECPDCKAYRLEKRAQRLKERAIAAEIPLALQGLSIDSLPGGPAADAIHEWIWGEQRGVCLTGSVGVGKTYHAAVGAWGRLQHGGIRWVSAARLMAQLRSGFSSEAKEKADRILATSGAIVLDDLDKVNPTEFGREVIFLAVDARVEAGAPLLVTTNKSMSELGEQLGEPVMSRIAGYCRTILMQGNDRRVAQLQ